MKYVILLTIIVGAVAMGGDLFDVQAGLEEGLRRIDRSKPAADPEREGRVARASADLALFGASYLPEHFFDSAAEYHAEVERAVEKRRLIAPVEPRAHGKTTRARRRILRSAATGRSPYIIIVRRDDADVKASILWLRTQFEKNAALRRDYGDLTGGQPWTVTEFVLANGVKIEGLTIGEPILGKLWGPHRPSEIHVDDPQTMEDVYSETIRQKHKVWLDHQAIPALADGGRLILYQNMIHEDCLIAHAHANPMFWSKQYDAILSDPERQDLWEKWEEIYRKEDARGEKDERRHDWADRFYARHKAEMNRGARLLWPRPDAYRRLMQVKIAIGEIVFWTQFRNKPYTGDKAQWLAWALASAVPQTAERIEGFDLASSQKATAAKFAKVQIAVDERGCVYVTEAYEDRVGFGQQLSLVTETPHPMLTARVIETNQYQAVLADTGKEYSLAGGATIVSRHTALSPGLRAMKIWRLMENGKLKFVRSPVIEKLAHQAVSYRAGHMPDLMSALELAVDHALQNAGGGAAVELLGDVMP